MNNFCAWEKTELKCTGSLDSIGWWRGGESEPEMFTVIVSLFTYTSSVALGICLPLFGLYVGTVHSHALSQNTSACVHLHMHTYSIYNISMQKGTSGQVVTYYIHRLPKSILCCASFSVPSLSLNNPYTHTHTGSMTEAVNSIEQLIPQSAASIVSQVSQSCSRNLEPAHTIPRLYRRTNREVTVLDSNQDTV